MCVYLSIQYNILTWTSPDFYSYTDTVILCRFFWRVSYQDIPDLWLRLKSPAFKSTHAELVLHLWVSGAPNGVMWV